MEFISSFVPALALAPAAAPYVKLDIGPLASSTFGPVMDYDTTKRLLAMPSHHRRILCFDTETTGLIPNHKKGLPYPADSEYPHIVQISWVIYNVATGILEEEVNEYVRLPEGVEISAEASSVNGITREVLETKGKSIVDILIRFFIAYMKCDCIVAHNIRFDSVVVRKEMRRHKEAIEAKIHSQERVNMMMNLFTQRFNVDHNIDTFCTMINSVRFCAIEKIEKDLNTTATIPSIPPPPAIPRQKSYKFPKLPELYQKLYDCSPPEDLHNSMVDVLVCLQCVLKLRGATEMSEKYFARLIRQYSR